MPKKTRTLSINGKLVKQIRKLDNEGNEIWTKHSPINSKGIDVGAHIIHKQPEENHLDIYKDGKKIDVDRNKKVRVAAIAIIPDFLGTKFVKLPPLPITKEEFDSMTPDERALAYSRRVKIINPDK